MAFWRKDNLQKNASTVVIAVRGDSFYVIRGYRDKNARAIKIQGEATFSIENSERLEQLLQEKLGCQETDIIYYTKPSPLLLGVSLTVNLPRYEAGHPVILDTREAMHRIKWKTADFVREEASHYFGCSLEEVGNFGVTVEKWKETDDEVEATLFHICVPKFSNEDNGLIQLGTNQFVLPIVLSQEVGSGDDVEAVLHTEDNLSTIAIRQNNQLKHLRSLNCGIGVIRDHLEKSLDCSKNEAEVLMKNCLEGKLSEANQKVIIRLMRQLLPLWAGMFSVAMDNIPISERPLKLLITGLFPKMIAQLYCRPQLLMRWSHIPVKVTTLMKDDDLLGMRSSLRVALKQMTRESNGLQIGTSVRSFQQVVS
jgi:hypothetical protein